MGASKGSNICFPYSQKFMSDGSAIGAYLLQLDSTVGRERLRIAAGVDGRGRPWIKEPKPRTNKRETRLWLWFFILYIPTATRCSQRYRHIWSSAQPSVKYWLRDNGPLVECIYYASVVNNTPKWASKRWLLDMLSCFPRTPPFPLPRDRFPPHQQQWACHTLRDNDYKIVEIRVNNLSANSVSVFLMLWLEIFPSGGNRCHIFET